MTFLFACSSTNEKGKSDVAKTTPTENQTSSDLFVKYPCKKEGGSLQGKSEIYISADNKASVEIGECVSGDCTDGQGELRYPSGSFYKGQFKNGMFHGNGLAFSCNRVFTEGLFEKNVRSKVKATFKNGDVLEGRMNPQGRLVEGKSTSKDGLIDEGTFNSEGNLTKGKSTSKEGDIWEGTFNSEGYLIKGKYTSKEGDILEGTFNSKGILTKGKYTYKDGNIEEGTFNSEGILTKGKYTSKEGDIWEGNWNSEGESFTGNIKYADGTRAKFKDGADVDAAKKKAKLEADELKTKRKQYSFCESYLNNLASIDSSSPNSCSMQCQTSCFKLYRNIHTGEGNACFNLCSQCWSKLMYDNHYGCPNTGDDWIRLKVQ